VSVRELPEPGPEWAAWWDATRERRLALQQCTSCGSCQHYPRALCTSCGADELEWRTASGDGTVYSYTVVYRPPGPSAPEPPYVVALVRLAEGPLVLTNVVGCEPGAVACDRPVTLTWEPLADGRALPLFTPS
jgi:uncharacterized OB-fold protein